MGHERLGVLPISKRWRDVVAQIADASQSESALAKLANSTIKNVESRYRDLNGDDGVKAAFQFLIALSSGRLSSGDEEASNLPNVDLSSNPSPIRLAAALRDWVNAHRKSVEYADLALKSATDAIVLWSEQQNRQPSLFRDYENATEIWRRANNGAGFCEVSRLFFAKFTERYLNYFLEREASAELSGIAEREQFTSQLREHINQVSKYAFETSRITQSFAAGWFNRYARHEMPSDQNIAGFLQHAFGKIREELLREGAWT